LFITRHKICCRVLASFDFLRWRKAWAVVFCLAPALTFADESTTTALLHIGSEFVSNDTLACGDEPSPDAKECLANLSWKPTKFTVRLEAAQPGFGDYLVRFLSARPVGNRTNDLVSMEWYAARDSDRAIRRARAIVVVHESGSRMTVGRLIARNLSGQGLHAFLVQLPGYGARRVAGFTTAEHLIPSMQQGIADVRRARVAVVALPAVDGSVVGLQGTSLGGFVAATVAGLDHGYDRVFILLAGGNLQEVLFNGSKEVEKARKKLAAVGVTDEQIKEFARQVEPLRLAHRIHPEETWLYSGELDKVVPPRNSLALAKAAHLPEGHHIEFAADHYLGIIYLPQAIGNITKQMAAKVEPRGSKD
jgi:dienelactone hydrolase